MAPSEMKEWMESHYDLNDNGCWVWKGNKLKGYGRVCWEGTMQSVHRFYWLLSGRTIPEGLHILHGHNCSKACFNPDHLKPGTQTENMADKVRDGTWQGGEKHSRAKLTETQVLAIRASENKFHRELAVEYGVTKTTITNIINRKIWKHLT
jgi:hypothetical protein